MDIIKNRKFPDNDRRDKILHLSKYSDNRCFKEQLQCLFIVNILLKTFGILTANCKIINSRNDFKSKFLEPEQLTRIAISTCQSLSKSNSVPLHCYTPTDIESICSAKSTSTTSTTTTTTSTTSGFTTTITTTSTTATVEEIISACCSPEVVDEITSVEKTLITTISQKAQKLEIMDIQVEIGYVRKAIFEQWKQS